jgi:hypothetical protein
VFLYLRNKIVINILQITIGASYCDHFVEAILLTDYINQMISLSESAKELYRDCFGACSAWSQVITE